MMRLISGDHTSHTARQKNLRPLSTGIHRRISSFADDLAGKPESYCSIQEGKRAEKAADSPKSHGMVPMAENPFQVLRSDYHG